MSMFSVVFALELEQFCETIATSEDALLPQVSCVVSQGAVGGGVEVVVVESPDGIVPWVVVCVMGGCVVVPVVVEPTVVVGVVVEAVWVVVGVVSVVVVVGVVSVVVGSE